jgi:hypothetical protein
MAGIKDSKFAMDNLLDGISKNPRRLETEKTIRPSQIQDGNLDNLFKTRQNLLTGEGVDNMSDYKQAEEVRVLRSKPV